MRIPGGGDEEEEAVAAVASAPPEHLVFAYYITGHGFGHATRALEVVRHLIAAGQTCTWSQARWNSSSPTRSGHSTSTSARCFLTAAPSWPTPSPSTASPPSRSIIRRPWCHSNRF